MVVIPLLSLSTKMGFPIITIILNESTTLRREFSLCDLSIRVEPLGGPYIISLVALVAYKVNFIADPLLIAIPITDYQGDDSNVNIKSPHTKFIVNNILHHVHLFELTKSQSCIAKTKIHKIIFAGRVNILFPLDVISL